MRLVALTLLVTLAAPAAAAPADGSDEAGQLLWRGIALYREASYAASVAALESARARGGLAPAQRVELAFYLGAGYLALSSPAAARRELKAVLRDEPDYEPPPFTSPKVAALFREVREELERAPRLRPLPPERRGDALVLRFEPSRTGGRAYGAVQWRWRGEHDWREAALTPATGRGGAELVASVPVDRTGALDYFAEARAPTGTLQAGSSAAPLELPVAVGPRRLAVAPTDDRARPRRLWWLWTGLGAVAAAGAGVGLYFALRPSPPATADAVFGFQVR